MSELRCGTLRGLLPFKRTSEAMDHKALPTTTTSSSNLPPLGPGTAIPGAPYWREVIKHQGTSAFHPKPSKYKVFRNVKEYGAKGDGIADDSGAIKSVSESLGFPYFPS
jgi:hypothetical protein